METINITVTSSEKSFVFPSDKSTPIDRMREAASKENGNSGDICNLIFRGKLLEDGTTVSDNGIAGDCTVRAVFQNPPPPSPNPTATMMSQRIQTLMINFRTCMRNYGTSAVRIDSLFKSLSEALRDISENDRNLLNNRAAYLMAQDPKLLRALLHKPLYITEALTQHPVLLDALSEAVKRLTKSVISSPQNVGQSEGSLPEHYGMDYLMIENQAEDDEEGEEDEEMEDRRGQYPPSNPLTSNQLSNALASAMMRSGPAEGTSSRPAASSSTPQQRTAPPRISASDLFSAMNQIPTEGPSSTVSSSASGTSAPQQEDPWREQVRALAELGFVDEQAVRHALEIAKGNVDMAVDILLG